MMNALSSSERSLTDFQRLTNSVGLKIIGIWESGSMPAVIECVLQSDEKNGKSNGSTANGLVSAA